MRTRVMIADDEPDILEALTELLQTSGHEVVGKATGGLAACTLAAERKPDIILMDIRMPDIDGLEATERIMLSNPTPVVLCSAHFDQDMLKRAIAAGAYSYVRKPFHSADVRAAVALALSRFREAQELQREIKQLKSALSTRKLVEKAKGIIMRAQKLDEEQAHRYLQLESQRRGQSVAELARAVVTADALLHSHNLNKDRILRLTEDEHK